MKNKDFILSEFIQDYFDNFTMTQLEDKYNITKKTVKKILESNGLIYKNKSLAHQKYKINSNYFEKINSEQKAYIFGFILADGNIYKTSLKIDLNKKDECILRYVLNCMQSEHKIYSYKNNRSILIRNVKLVEDLKKLGCFPNKSHNLPFPTFDIIPKDLLHHFVRGYFDGDGSIQLHLYKSPIWRFSICAPLNFALSLKSQFEQINVKMGIIQDKRISIDMKSLYCSSTLGPEGVFHVKNLYNYLYDNFTFSLDRKRKIFLSIFLESKNHKSRFKKIWVYGKTYASCLEASKVLGVSKSCISYYLKTRPDEFKIVEN